MVPEDSVTEWMTELKAGDQQAAEPLWQRYFRSLESVARRLLQGANRRMADEEDVALSAFASLCQGLKEGRFPQLRDREDLWSLLVVITERKALRLIKDQQRQKRGGGKVRGDSVLGIPHHTSEGPGLGQIVSHEPTPELVAIMAEECQRLLGRLGSPDLRKLAVWKMEGYTNEEIAAKISCSLRTVERKLRLIRDTWAAEIDS